MRIIFRLVKMTSETAETREDLRAGQDLRTGGQEQKQRMRLDALWHREGCMEERLAGNGGPGMVWTSGREEVQ